MMGGADALTRLGGRYPEGKARLTELADDLLRRPGTADFVTGLLGLDDPAAMRSALDALRRHLPKGEAAPAFGMGHLSPAARRAATSDLSDCLTGSARAHRGFLGACCPTSSA